MFSGYKCDVDIAGRIGTKWMTMVPGNCYSTQLLGMQTAHVVDALMRSADILEPHCLADPSQAGEAAVIVAYSVADNYYVL